MQQYKRNSIFSELRPFCHLSDDDDYIEITEWKNGEGYDVNINTKSGDKTISLTYGQFKAMKKLIKLLDKGE
jgi:hypothetical protein